MKIRVECRTLAEYEAAIQAGNVAVIFNLKVVANAGAHVVACGSSHVVACGSSHVVAWGSSHVEARESSHVVAWGNSFVRLFAALKVHAAASVVVMMHGTAKEMKGGIRVKAVKPKTALAWCKFWGVEVKAGIATLFKAVDEDFSTENARRKNISYKPGEKPQAPDWDGGEQECGGGLHFSPHPAMALEFNINAKHFVACPVAIKGLSIHPDGSYPQKVKAQGCAAPVYEVNRKGERV